MTVQNFDAEGAKKYFIVCVPTVYGKLFPRLLCCPDYQYFDPLHVDGCVKQGYHPPQPAHLPQYSHPVEHIPPVYYPKTYQAHHHPPPHNPTLRPHHLLGVV